VSDTVAIATAGSLAGIAGWVFVYPIDVIKTKIQSEPSLIWKDRVSCYQMYRRLLKESGPSVFTRGFGATILRAVPTNAVIFGAYELTLEICSRISGSDKTKILSATIWLTDMATFPEMNMQWDIWVPAGDTPARATVQAALAAPEYKVEIAVIAAR
jgi:hypothetical protein